MLVRGRPNALMDVLLRRAVDALVIGVAAYFGFLADTTKAVHDTQTTVEEIKGKVDSAAAKAAACEEKLQKHLKAQPK